jgi:hypothetical protein
LLPWIAEAGDDDFAAVAERAPISMLVDFCATCCGPCPVVGAALEQLASERGREVAGRQAGAAPAAVLRRWPDDVLAEPKPSEEKEPS